MRRAVGLAIQRLVRRPVEAVGLAQVVVRDAARALDGHGPAPVAAHGRGHGGRRRGRLGPGGHHGMRLLPQRPPPLRRRASRWGPVGRARDLAVPG